MYIGTAALIAMGCTVCQRCYTGKCPWGIATSDPWISKRINPDIASKRLVNMLNSWSLEIKDMMGGMGINAIESLRGNRLALRGVGLSRAESKNLGRKIGRRIKQMLEQKPKLEIDAKYLPIITKENNVLKIDAEGLYYRELNCLLRQAICTDGIEKIEI